MKALPLFLLGLGSTPPGRPPPEAPVETRLSPPKGYGVFATGPIANGTVVCGYEGDLLTLAEQEARYPDSWPDYCLRLSPELSIDAERSGHWSRFVNHDERPNLVVETSLAPEPSARFRAIRDIAAGEELCFDYGPVYFYARGITPAPGTESRTVSLAPRPVDEAAVEEERAWAASGLPDAPATVDEIGRVLSSAAVSEGAKKAALARALDYFGAIEWIDEDAFFLALPGLAETEKRRVAYSSSAPEELAASLEEVVEHYSAGDKDRQ
ncbi:unnamed protein product [Pseudo-nitzschia multistriata]|uniref:SET domain-containing protein n=1 Tax=Pseudo-nitzschia multistriata TaxID=183589 RepID=A0A448Z317_9STRA|nr:unnamed protein product [Pseudo-nitzschia multistriata]